MFFGQRYEGLALPPSLAEGKSTMRVGRKPRFAAGPPFHCPPKPQRTQNTAIKQISNLIYMASSRERQRVGGRWSPDGWAWRAGARQGQSSERSVGQKQSKFRCSGPAGRFVLWRKRAKTGACLRSRAFRLGEEISEHAQTELHNVSLPCCYDPRRIRNRG